MSNRTVNNPVDFQAGANYMNYAKRAADSLIAFNSGYEAYKGNAKGLEKLREILNRAKDGLTKLSEFSGELPATAIVLRQSIESNIQDSERKLTTAEEEQAKRRGELVGAC